MVFREVANYTDWPGYRLRKEILRMLAIMTPSFTPAAQQVLNEDVRLSLIVHAQLWLEQRTTGSKFVVKNLEFRDLRSDLVDKAVSACRVGIKSLAMINTRGIDPNVLGGANLRGPSPSRCFSRSILTI